MYNSYEIRIFDIMERPMISFILENLNGNKLFNDTNKRLDTFIF